MRISRSEMKLTGIEACKIFGSVPSYNQDYSLAGLYRAIVIDHEGCSDIATVISRGELFFSGVYGISDMEYIAKNITGMTVAKCTVRLDDIKFDKDGWETFDDGPYYLNRYLSQVAKSKVYINRKSRRVIALVENAVTPKWIQAFESVLWAVLPWYYPEKNEETIRFFRTFAIDNKEYSEEEATRVLVDYVNKVAETVDIRDLYLRKILDGYASRALKAKIDAQADEVDNIASNIEDFMTGLKNAYIRLADAQRLLEGLRKVDAGNDPKLIEFFSQHKNIIVAETEGSVIRYGVDDVLEFYDVDEAKSLFDNEYSWVRDTYTKTFVNRLRQLFVEKRGIFRVSANFTLTDMKLVSPVRGSYPVTESLPNPHIYFYACSGANDQYYSQYAKQGDWDLAIEQSIAATKNWSVGDSAVGSRMFGWIDDYSDTKCIYVKDGSPMNGVTPDCKLVTFNEFKEIVDQKIQEEQKEKEREAVNNG